MNVNKLYKNVQTRGIVCLGLDTSPAYLPEQLLNAHTSPADAVFAFNKALIDATADIVACYKVQIAYYEALGPAGMAAFAKTLKYIRSVDQLAITDCKRGDIKETASMYAKAHFEGDFETDFITLNPYMGIDTLEPYEPYFERGKGCFVLMRTSNPGSKDFQFLDCGGKKLYEIVGERIAEYGEKFKGEHGYSSIGAVIGATSALEAQTLRRRLGSTFFLIPGFGAQGGKAEDAALYFQNANGGVVNSSRAILTAWKKAENGAERYAAAAREEAIATNEKIRAFL